MDWARRSRQADRKAGSYGRALPPDYLTDLWPWIEKVRREEEAARLQAILDALLPSAKGTPEVANLWIVAWDGRYRTLLSADGPWEAAQRLPRAMGMIRSSWDGESVSVPDIAQELAQHNWYLVDSPEPEPVRDLARLPETVAQHFRDRDNGVTDASTKR